MGDLEVGTVVHANVSLLGYYLRVLCDLWGGTYDWIQMRH